MNNRAAFLLLPIVFAGLFLFANTTLAAVSVVAPNGGECLVVGQAYTIKFTFNTDHVALYYRTDSQQPTHLDSSLIKHPLQQSSWAWTPTSADISETGRIWVEGHFNNHNSTGEWDQSNADFAVRTSCGGGGSGGGGGGGGSGGDGGSLAVGGDIYLTPPTIKNLTAKNITTSSAVISWQTDRVTYYKFEYGTSTGKYSKVISTGPPYSDRADHELKLENLAEGTTYYFKITAGIFQPIPTETGEQTFKTLDATPPAPARGAFGVAGDETALVAWLNPFDVDYLKTVIVRRADRFAEKSNDGELVFVGTDTHYNDTGLTNDTTYYYSIFTADSSGNVSRPVNLAITPKTGLGRAPEPPPPSSTSTAPTSTLVLRVKSLTSGAGEDTIALRWLNPEDPNFLGVQIVRNEESLPANAYDGEVVFRGRANSLEDAGLLPEKRYNYGVFVFDWKNNFYQPAYISEMTNPREKDIKELVAQIEEVKRLVRKLIAAFLVKFPGLQIKPIEEQPAVSSAPARGIYQVIVITDGFTPRIITVPRGATVRWVNRSNKPAWVASDIHPTHETYDGTTLSEHCEDKASSTFDACHGIPPGGTYSFKFERIGKWGYHDHLHPDVRNGEVVVK